MFKMNRQKAINKSLKGIKSFKRVYSEYGRIFKVNLFHILFILDLFVPSFRFLTYIGYKFKHIEVLRFTIKKDWG